MTEKYTALFPLKEEPQSKISNIKKNRKSPMNNKNFNTKRSVRINLDVNRLIQKKPFIPKSDISSPVDLCLVSLDNLPKQRSKECLKHIITYLKSLPNFMNIISKEKNIKLSETLIEQISIHLRHEFIPINNLICRFGEKGEKFYIILKGKVIFIVPKPGKCYLNLEEYIIYLMQLRRNNELEILKNVIIQNRYIYQIDNDDFDYYINEEYKQYQKYLMRRGRNNTRAKTKIIPNRLANNKVISLTNSITREINPSLRKINLKSNKNIASITIKSNKNLNNIIINSNKDLNNININNIKTINNNINDRNEKDKNQKIFFSPYTYKKMEEIIDIINNKKVVSKEDPFKGLNSPKNYLKLNNVANTELDAKGRKLVNMYTYEEMSIFENGQNFGFIALQSKNCKRVATAIAIEDCDLGVLNKAEYLQFFEMISNKEKKSLYELLKFYNLITTVSELKFIKKYYHMFEYIKYYKNNPVMDINNKINDLKVFNTGLYIVNICVNIPELNELIIKLKNIRGNLLGLAKRKIEKQLHEIRENQEIIMRKNYMTKEDKKLLFNKNNLTISIVSDHLIIGYADTVDPDTRLPYFNCTCLSAEGDAYYLSNRNLYLVNKDSVVIHNLKDFCLKKLEYNINRLQQFKKEIVSKSSINDIFFHIGDEMESSGVNSSRNKNGEKSLNENIININGLQLNNNSKENANHFINRNDIVKKEGNNNNKTLLASKINSNIIETLNNYNNLKTRAKINSVKNIDKDINSSKSDIIRKLRESILQKEKKIEFKKEQYFKIIENINRNKKEKMKKKLESSISLNNNSPKDADSSFVNKNIEKNKYMSDVLNTRIQSPFSREDFSPKNNYNYFNLNYNINKDKKNIDNINTISYNSNTLQNTNNKENLLTLPAIEKNKFSYYITNLKTESQPKVNLLEQQHTKQNTKKTNNFISYDEYNQLPSLSTSLVKEKYIVFKTPHRPVREDFINIEQHPIQPKMKSLKPARIKKNKNLVLDDIEKNCEDKKIDYINIISFNNQIKENNLINSNIKEKYKELNNLVKSLQKTKNEVIDE